MFVVRTRRECQYTGHMTREYVCHIDIAPGAPHVPSVWGKEGSSVTDRFYEELGAAIRTRREALGMTQAELGSRIELSRTSVTNLECGRQRLLIDQFCKLADVLGCDREELLSAAVAAAAEDEPPMADLSSMPTVAEFVEKTLRSTERKR